MFKSRVATNLKSKLWICGVRVSVGKNKQPASQSSGKSVRQKKWIEDEKKSFCKLNITK